MEEIKKEETIDIQIEFTETTEEREVNPEEIDQEQQEETRNSEEMSENTEESAVLDDSDLIGVVGVRFRTAGKSYYFAVGGLPVKRGSHVIVETARGLEYGISVCDPMRIHHKQFKAPIKKIVRMAEESDEKRVKENREKEREAFHVCFEKIHEHELDMKLIDAEYTFDGSKLLFYFTSDGRVDFRDLVKDLAGIFHIRIELRQIGVRDETKILGGYGICGRPLCCHTYLTDFVPVSIKMAKEQNLSLNPTKISGSCGRLMCCLKNEEETYEELNKSLPRLGDEVQTGDGLTGSVISVNILKQSVRILVEVDDEKEVHECAADTLTILHRRKRGQAKPKVNRAELKNSGKSRQSGRTVKIQDGNEERSERPETIERRAEDETEHSTEGRSEKSKAENRSDRQERRERSQNRRNRRDRQGGEGAAGLERGENTQKTPGNGASKGTPKDRNRNAAVKENRSRQELPKDNESKEAAGEGNHRRHRYRRKNNNDRRKEEKPSATE